MTRPDDRAAAAIVAHLCEHFDRAGVYCLRPRWQIARGETLVFYGATRDGEWVVPVSADLIANYVNPQVAARRIAGTIAAGIAGQAARAAAAEARLGDHPNGLPPR